MPLSGDMAKVIIPNANAGYHKVLQDPFGISVFTNSEPYENPNRYFAHAFTSQYFLKAPIFLQKFVSPITSVYLSVALLKTLLQLLIVYVICMFSTNSTQPFKLNFII